MKKVLLLLFVASILVVSCKKDDTYKEEPPRDRGKEALAAQNEIEGFLSKYTYNYEEFENPSADFDFRIVMDSIAPGSNKTPLIDLVSYKTVEDPEDSKVKYKLYYLKVEQGKGVAMKDAQAAYITYEAYRVRDNQLIEETNPSDPKPFVFETKSSKGIKEALLEFNAADGYVENPDGTVTYNNYGIGAVFVPSGLAFFNRPPVGVAVGVYNQLIYSFHVKGAKVEEE